MKCFIEAWDIYKQSIRFPSFEACMTCTLLCVLSLWFTEHLHCPASPHGVETVRMTWQFFPPSVSDVTLDDIFASGLACVILIAKQSKFMT